MSSVTVINKTTGTVHVQETGRPGPAGLVWQDAGWVDGTRYQRNWALYHDGTSYRALVEHVASPETEPGVGADWETVWQVLAEKGDKGDAATIEVGDVTTLEPDQPASVENAGTSGAARFNFGIPKGDKGDKGDVGDVTPEAEAARDAAQIAAGTATTQANRADTEADRAELARDAAEDAVQYNYLVADNTALNAIVGMVTGERAFVRATEHVWHYDGAAWVDDGLAPTAEKANKTDVVSRDMGLHAARAALAADRATDAVSPLWVWPYELINMISTPATSLAVEFDIASRDSDTQFTVGAGQATAFSNRGAVVIRDDTSGRYKSFRVNSVVGDTATIIGGVLPAVMTRGQALHRGNNDQHLSRFGYNAYADFIADQAERYKYRKAHPLLGYYGAVFTGVGASSNTAGQIATFDGSKIAIPVERLGTAGTGGFVPGSATVAKGCNHAASDQSVAGVGMEGHLFSSRSYLLQDSTGGNGFAISFDAGGLEGFIELALAVSDRASNNEAVDGEVVLTVEADGVTLFSEQLPLGMHFKVLDFPQCYSVRVTITAAGGGITSARLSYLMAWAKSSRTPAAAIFRSGDRIAFLMDSWGVYPPPESGETPPIRPDGTAGEGMQYIPERLRQRLADDGIQVTTRNWSRGGQTSAWASYWLHKIIEDAPTHCVLHFSINDDNSKGNVAGSTPSAYDFSPVDMWASQSSASGGVFGSTSPDQWKDNMRLICRRLMAAGIKPIVLGVPLTASYAQAQRLMLNYASRIFGGDEPLFEMSGRT